MVTPGGGLAEAGGLLDQEGGHVLVDRALLIHALVVLDQYRDQGGGAAVGQPHLLPGDGVLKGGPVVGLGQHSGLGRDRRDVGAQAGLGHRERAADLTGRHQREVLLLLLGCAVLHQHVGHDEVGVDDPGDAHPAPRDLLHAQRVGQQRLAEPAVLLGDHQAEDAELLKTLDDLGGVLIGVLELLRDRDDLLIDEDPHRLEDLGLVLGESLGAAQACHLPSFRSGGSGAGVGRRTMCPRTLPRSGGP